jgi:hypothetical protein
MERYRRLRVRSELLWRPGFSRLSEQPPPEGLQLWGAFRGLFGIGNRELLLALTGDGVGAEGWLAGAGFETSEVLGMVPTARPVDSRPLDRDGVYVWRSFEVRTESVEEFVELSVAAWDPYETDDEFAAEPFGLFRADRPEEGRVTMLLATWYDGLASWERSRTPSGTARQNFMRRGELTLDSSAVATRLISPETD